MSDLLAAMLAVSSLAGMWMIYANLPLYYRDWFLIVVIVVLMAIQ